MPRFSLLAARLSAKEESSQEREPTPCPYFPCVCKSVFLVAVRMTDVVIVCREFSLRVNALYGWRGAALLFQETALLAPTQQPRIGAGGWEGSIVSHT